MIEHLRQLIARYARKGLLIDTNILLLYFVGSFDPNRILSFKNTKQFTVEDYRTLLLLLNTFEKIVTTPNILTEVSNFLNQLGEPARSLCFQTSAEKIGLMEEHYIDSQGLVTQEEYIKHGLTDTGIISLSKSSYLILTDDFKLSQHLQKRGLDAINFNHIRVLGWN